MELSDADSTDDVAAAAASDAEPSSPLEHGPTIEVSVTELDGSPLATVDIARTRKLSDLKAQVAAATEIHVDEIAFVFDGRTLDGLDFPLVHPKNFGASIAAADGEQDEPLSVAVILIRVPKPIFHQGMPSDRGAFTGCGGNPKGAARCAGQGNCSPNCKDCGAGTHWKCCGSSDTNSLYCVLGTTPEQAKKNYDLCTEEYSSENEEPNYVEVA
eukprot:TRINITY_DN28137_c0_g1_i1.p1 TRINITY_DN28137_c0_g1~~TRINITY_DN28137_c0_g1_i1.p1  ORF type:complete len:229 (+),score=50.91 TRINITY_DN28137_c0_g1_i1:47-688(+)